MLDIKQNKKAFTIIEVVMVLAIAGLIFLVVFQAIPRLQASRRDNQRKSDMQSLAALFIEYESNTGLNPPRSGANSVADAFDSNPSGNFWDQYASTLNITCPNGEGYIWSATSNPGECGFYYHNTAWICAPTKDSYTRTGANTNSWFLLFGLERGESCIDKI